MLQHVAADSAVQRAGRERERVKPARAADEIGVNRSSLSRYFEKYPHLVDSAGLVDVDELRQHRAENLSVPAAEKAKPERAKKSDDAAAGKSNRSRHSEARARLAEIQVEKEELERGARAGELVEAAAVADALIEAANVLRDRLLSPEMTLAERLAAEADPKICAQLVREWSRAALEGLLAELGKIGDTPAE